MDVSLRDVILRTNTYCYASLLKLVRVCATKSDAQRKTMLTNFLKKTRARYLALLALLRWSRTSQGIIFKAQQQLGRVAEQQQHLVRFPDILYFLSEGLRNARAPIYDVDGAVEILSQGTYNQLPAVLMPQYKPRVLQVAPQHVLDQLDEIILRRLYTQGVHACVSDIQICDGVAHLTVGQLFVLQIAAAPTDDIIDSCSWMVKDLTMLLAYPGGDHVIDESQRVELLTHVHNILVEQKRSSLNRSLEFMATVTQRLALFALGTQTSAQSAFTLTPGPDSLAVSYWSKTYLGPPENAHQIIIRVAPGENHLSVSHEPELPDGSPDIPLSHSDLNLAKLVHLTQTVRLDALFQLLNASSPMEGEVRNGGTPAISLWTPCSNEFWLVLRCAVDGSLMFVAPQWENVISRATRTRWLRSFSVSSWSTVVSEALIWARLAAISARCSLEDTPVEPLWVNPFDKGIPSEDPCLFLRYITAPGFALRVSFVQDVLTVQVLVAVRENSAFHGRFQHKLTFDMDLSVFNSDEPTQKRVKVDEAKKVLDIAFQQLFTRVKRLSFLEVILGRNLQHFDEKNGISFLFTRSGGPAMVSFDSDTCMNWKICWESNCPVQVVDSAAFSYDQTNSTWTINGCLGQEWTALRALIALKRILKFARDLDQHPNVQVCDNVLSVKLEGDVSTTIFIKHRASELQLEAQGATSKLLQQLVLPFHRLKLSQPEPPTLKIITRMSKINAILPEMMRAFPLREGWTLSAISDGSFLVAFKGHNVLNIFLHQECDVIALCPEQNLTLWQKFARLHINPTYQSIPPGEVKAIKTIKATGGGAKACYNIWVGHFSGIIRPLRLFVAQQFLMTQTLPRIFGAPAAPGCFFLGVDLLQISFQETQLVARENPHSQHWTHLPAQSSVCDTLKDLFAQVKPPFSDAALFALHTLTNLVYSRSPQALGAILNTHCDDNKIILVRNRSQVWPPVPPGRVFPEVGSPCVLMETSGVFFALLNETNGTVSPHFMSNDLQIH